MEFAFALWTRDMVRELIRREFRISLSAVSVGRMLRTLGLPPQRPLWRAWQADPGVRHSLNMISAVTAQGLLRFSTYTGSLTGARFIEFCRKLIADTDGPVYLVVDGHPVHRSRLAKEFVASTEGRLKLFVLPAYSPQLNPDEWVWKNVKHDRVGRTSGRTRAGRRPAPSRPRRAPPSPRCRGG